MADPIEPVEELRRHFLVPVPDDLDRRHLVRLQCSGGAPFLDAHDVVAVEHRRAAFALEAVVLAMPRVGLSSCQIVSFVASEAPVRHPHDEERARLAVE